MLVHEDMEQKIQVWRHSVNSSMGLSKFVFLSVSV